MTRDRNDPTYRRAQGQYGTWTDANPPRREGSAIAWPEEGLPIPELSPATARVLFTAIGFGLGALLLVLSVTAFVASRSWAAVGRDGASVGYSLPTLFLAIAGLGCILATYNHQFRVATGRAGTHH